MARSIDMEKIFSILIIEDDVFNDMTMDFYPRGFM